MASYHVDAIHTIALVGHEVAGKTSLADALLHKAKATERRCSVEDGTSVSDFDDEEKKHRYSIDSSVLHLDHDGKRVHLLDTPGKPDFVGQALGALNAVDTAILVISATAGVQVNTRRMFAEAGKRGLARMIVVNRLDSDNVHFDELLQSIRDSLGTGCVLFNVPNAVGPDFKSVVCMLNPGDTKGVVDPATVRSQLVDAIVESDEKLMEKYLSEGDVSADELAHALPHALAAGTVIPIFCTSAKRGNDVGIDELLEAIFEYAPTPIDAVRRKATKPSGEEFAVEPEENGEFIAQVFKTISDKFVGTLSYLRVLSGKLKPDQQLFNAKTGRGGRCAGILLVQGKTSKPMAEAIPGDIIALAKVENLHIGDTVGTHAGGPRVQTFPYPHPMFGLAVEPKARGDEQKMSGSLHKIVEEDPTFKVTRDAQTKELVITGMSQLHLDILQHRLKSRYELEIVTHEPKIPYRETITAAGEADHRHKKQSGGRGQFGEVHLRVYPLKDLEIKSEQDLHDKFANKSKFEKIRTVHYDADHNFAFIDHIVGGSIPVQFIPAVEKGCKELLEQGALAGYRMQDVAVEVHFGKQHDVDSSEAAFKTAGRMAFKKAFREARPVLLEPIVTLEVTIPAKYTGSILGDLNTKRARVENQDSLPGDQTVITAKAPLGEMTRYAAQLGSITQGTGAFSMEFSHYDVVPGAVQQQIVAKAKMVHDEDE